MYNPDDGRKAEIYFELYHVVYMYIYIIQNVDGSKITLKKLALCSEVFQVKTFNLYNNMN